MVSRFKNACHWIKEYMVFHRIYAEMDIQFSECLVLSYGAAVPYAANHPNPVPRWTSRFTNLSGVGEKICTLFNNHCMNTNQSYSIYYMKSCQPRRTIPPN